MKRAKAIHTFTRSLFRPLLQTIACLFFVLHWDCGAQVTSTPSPDYTRLASLDGGPDVGGLDLPHNTPKAIRNELLDNNIIHLLVKFGGLTAEELATVQIFRSPDNEDVMVGQLGNDESGFKKLNDLLQGYMNSRGQGHTKAFLMAGLTNRLSAIKDRDLRIIATNREPYWAPFPVSWLKKIDSGTQSYTADGTPISETPDKRDKSGRKTHNHVPKPKAAEVRRWIRYSLIDGGLGWDYTVEFKANGSLLDMMSTRCDAKEFEPKYRKVIKQVEAEVQAEMKKQGVAGLGSVHTFWALKRDKLKAKGIEWRSPSELNPNYFFD